jgi:hypothetical protein
MASINTDIAQTLDITCRRGDTFAVDITFRDSSNPNTTIVLDSGYTFHMHVRSSDEDDSNAPLLSDGASGTGVHGTITLTPGANGKVSVLIDDTSMKNIPGGEYVYDIQAAKDDDTIQTWVKGVFLINEDVTHFSSQ